MELVKQYPPEVGEIMEEVKERYKITHQRSGIHCTDCIYCLRKAFWNNLSPLPPNPTEMLYFLLGLGLQDALLGGDNPTAATVDGISISPDYWNGDVLGELKTTRMAEKTIEEKGLPEGWVKQMMAYSYALGVKSCFLLVLPLIKPAVLSYVLTFTEEELQENWNTIVQNSVALKKSLETGIPPRGEWGSWQCRDCRYNYRCKNL